MNWVKRYLAEIERGNIVVPKKVCAVYQRECEWMERPPDDPAFVWHFDEKLGEKHIKFMETFCRQSKGKYGGKNIEFMLFQKAKFQLAFGWVDDSGNRRFREVIDIRARKNGKSTEGAALAHDMLLNDRENGPEIYIVANSRDQAKAGVFTEAVNMMQQSPALRTIEKKRQADIYSPVNFGCIKPLASKTDNLDGLNAHLVIQDEFHEQKNSALYDVMKQSQSFRDQPLYWLISTNGFQREAFFDTKYYVASKVATWEEGYRDYTVLPLIYELDSRSEWTDESMWQKANPGLGVIKQVKTLREHVAQAQRDPSFLQTLLTKDFNMPENSADGWLQFDDAVNETVVDMEDLRNSYAIGGCDLSATTDLTCATVILRKPDDPNTYVLQKYFIPQSKMDVLRGDTNNGLEAPYKKWAERGWLTVCEGATVNYHDVTMWFVEMVEKWDIRPLWVCYDAALSGYWREEMETYGFEMEKIRQGPFTWSYPMKVLKGAFEEHRVVYQNNPMLRWCLLNPGVKTTNKDGIATIQPVKMASAKRIDGMVSLLNAWVGMQNHEEEYMRFVK